LLTLQRIARLVPAALLALPTLCFAADGVLILHSNQRVTPAAIIVENELRKIVPEALQRPVDVFSEYLDVEWTSTEAFAATQAEFLRQKYERRNVRVIVCSAAQALEFVNRFRDRILPGVPVVHLVLPKDQLERMSLPADFVGRTVDLDPTATFQLALRLQPDARHLVIVLGASERDRVWEARVRKAVGRLEGPLEVEYLVGLPTANVLRRLGALTRDTIVYTPGYLVDGVGQVSTPRASVELIAPASAAPVYGPLDTFLGTGIVGGYMAPYEEQARGAGSLVVRVLNGAPASQIAATPIENVPLVDWRALRRWNIDERLLPPNTVVKFREPSAWDLHWREFSLAAAIVVFQAALISALLIERRSRRRTALALEESQKRMNLAARAASLSTLIWDIAHEKTRSSARSPPLPNERSIAFEDVLQTAHPADREALERAVNGSLATGEEVDVEYRVIDPGGNVRWIAARGRAETGDRKRLLGVAIDITERKRAELRAVEDRIALRHITRVSMLGQLSASIAHQLNQPLAAILGNAEAARKMLGRDNVDLVELREICDDIVSEDHRAAQVIRGLGALYKRGEMKMEPLDLNALIRETLDLLRAELLIRHVTPATDLAPSLPSIDGDSIQLQQMLLNLILNAADAMHGRSLEDRRLTIRTRVTEAEVLLDVVDNGPGIAADDLPQIFDAFWSTKPGGMGMGLAICQSIVAAHRGTITATNNAEGGATFCAGLPMTERT
jgi:C4-dicarboxylate-specific signal transduction histidine kinase